ncbi:RodZ domain-containing protein [uncultured Paraglaciecola sp.]|uniref:RodZ domain-containing protein n=1 Tax=uncultured Paraglaciecola sp. TaxID=1765024 RepID=UPI0025D4120E|nr:RodZ domain-containing protein [uncultured Paraglaciecola sp.]
MIENEEVEQIKVVMQGPGQILKEARERAKLTTQDIADKMKLKKALIQDIEQDNYDIDISLTFIRGYLKLYAKHVKVSEKDILGAFESLSTQKKEPAKLQSFSRRVANQANDDKLMLVTYLIVAAVAALVVIWWFRQSPTITATESNSNNYSQAVSQGIVVQETLTPDLGKLISTPTGAAVLPKDITDTNDDILLSTAIEEQNIDVRSVNNQPVFEKNEDDINTLAQQSDITTNIDNESVTPVELIFKFSGDCWMNLSDATGENIAYGVKVKGRVMPVTGIPPFIVTLGAPEVVKISYAGESLNMSFLPSGRIAKFDLPLSE